LKKKKQNKPNINKKKQRLKEKMEALAASFNWVMGHERKTVALFVLPSKRRGSVAK